MYILVKFSLGCVKKESRNGRLKKEKNGQCEGVYCALEKKSLENNQQAAMETARL